MVACSKSDGLRSLEEEEEEEEGMTPMGGTGGVGVGRRSGSGVGFERKSVVVEGDGMEIGAIVSGMMCSGDTVCSGMISGLISVEEGGGWVGV